MATETFDAVLADVLGAPVVEDRHFDRLAAAHAAEVAELEQDAERMLKSLRVAVIALAHAAESDKTYTTSYEHVSATLAGVAIRYDRTA